MRPICVLQILDMLSWGSGVSAVVLNYYQWIDPKEVRFDFMVNKEPENSIKKMVEERGSHIYVMPTLRITNLRIYQKSLRTFFRDHPEYEIVHGHMPHLAFLYLKEAANAGIPVRIMHCHNTSAADRRLKCMRNYIFAKLGMRYANQYMSCGEMAAKYFCKDLDRRKKEVFLLFNAVDGKKFHFYPDIRVRMRKELKAEGKYVIGHVGRFCPQKNQEFLIQVFEVLYKKHPETRLFLIGDGEERNRIIRLIQNKGIEEAVFLLKQTERVEDYLQAMDIFVLPSKFEGVPVVGIEAQASGLPCVFSSEVTKEIQTEDTHYLPLCAGEAAWAEYIWKQRNAGRKNRLMRNYDIRTASQRLSRRYQEYLVQEYNKTDGESTNSNVHL